MGYIEVVKGDLIEMAVAGEFDVIAHGCNCFCVMGAGLARAMAAAFHVNELPLEDAGRAGDINKLGCVEWGRVSFMDTLFRSKHDLWVVNAYTQYDYGRNPGKVYLDYNALTLCLRKIAHGLGDKRLGLPFIGCGLGGGDSEKVYDIMNRELHHLDVKIVEFIKQ